MLLYYLRHGDPTYEPNELTPLGRRQAEALGRRLSQFGLDEVYCSSSERAVQTAAPTCEMLKLKPTPLDWADERLAWADLSTISPEGKRTWCFNQEAYRQVFASREMRSLGDEWHTHPVFQGTTIKAGVDRVAAEADRWLASLGFAHDRDRGVYRVSAKGNRRIALFAHAGFGITFLSCVEDIPFPTFATHFDMSHSGMTVLWFPEDRENCIPVVYQLSNDSHLYREGLPLAYNNGLRI